MWNALHPQFHCVSFPHRKKQTIKALLLFTHSDCVVILKKFKKSHDTFRANLNMTLTFNQPIPNEEIVYSKKIQKRLLFRVHTNWKERIWNFTTKNVIEWRLKGDYTAVIVSVW